jgi:hypothetical protein
VGQLDAKLRLGGILILQVRELDFSRYGVGKYGAALEPV